MKRKLISDLLKWKENSQRKPLILEGARQVGKTFLLREFGKLYYKNVVYLNLENPGSELKQLFDGTIEPNRILDTISLLTHQEIIPGDTLIILDEIQELPRALTALKYFREQAPEYHIAVSGSLLGLFLHQKVSFPVGQVYTLKLEPFSFEEFLWALDEERIVQRLADEPKLTFFDEFFNDSFRKYLAIGGMPEAIKTWVQTGDIIKVEAVHQEILHNYESDFSKYADTTIAIKIRQIWNGLTSQFAKKNEKFIYGAVKSGARARDFEIAIQWLIDCGLVRKVTKIKRGDKLPLKAYEDINSFKLYFVDVGLFRTLAGIPSSAMILQDAIFTEFNGLLAEQYVLQELSEYNLFYWTSEAKSEVDFVAQIDNHIVPIEVKSGKNVKAKSLRVYREKYNPKLALRFSLLPLKYNDGLLNIPLYKSWLFSLLIADY